MGRSPGAVEVGYRLDRRVRGIRPGMHAGTETGDGLEPLLQATLLDGRDPRRLDLLASLRDPLRRLLVRRYRQRASTRVQVIADLSASLEFRGRGNRLDILAGLVSALGYSAARAGDAFGFIGCDESVRAEFVLPPTRMAGGRLDLAARLRAFTPRGRGSDGLLEAVPMIGHRRSLVFLISDFHFPLTLLETVLAGLSRHQIVPVILRDSGEAEPAQRFGLMRVLDPETGQEQTLLMRPALRHRIRARAEERRAAVSECLAAHGTRPLVLTDRFDVDRVNRHFSP
ncbi:MAG: hypothetical protein OXC11_05715 [Rhodospirillales bacterium]|nr:hypothetical protein [Rhodospirillales bacterium]